MAFASFDNRPSGSPMAEINMVPLIDVLLVLLVIFIVTAPLLTHAVKLELPQATAQPEPPPPQRIELAINAAGALYWDGEPVTRAQARQRFAQVGAQPQKPALALRADQAVAYRVVAQTLADAAQGGLTQIGFVSLPEPAR